LRSSFSIACSDLSHCGMQSNRSSVLMDFSNWHGAMPGYLALGDTTTPKAEVSSRLKQTWAYVGTFQRARALLVRSAPEITHVDHPACHPAMAQVAARDGERAPQRGKEWFDPSKGRGGRAFGSGATP